MPPSFMGLYPFCNQREYPAAAITFAAKQAKEFQHADRQLGQWLLLAKLAQLGSIGLEIGDDGMPKDCLGLGAKWAIIIMIMVTITHDEDSALAAPADRQRHHHVLGARRLSRW